MFYQCQCQCKCQCESYCGQRQRSHGPMVSFTATSSSIVKLICRWTIMLLIAMVLIIVPNVNIVGAEKVIISMRQFPPSVSGRPRRHLQQQQRAAFDLVRLEQQLLALAVARTRQLPADSRQSLKDEPNPNPGHRMIDDDEDGTTDANGVPIDGCREQCDEQLRMGLDMVKAHSAFGTIGVPSVIDASDLQLFCRVDTEHDACLLGCGYQVQFNMRDFVCKRKRKELVSHLDCYANAAPQLRRQCGVARCGPYQQLEHTLLGISQRCRTLLCDTQCIRAQLARHAACRQGGRPAAQLLVTHSQIQPFWAATHTHFQVLAWLRDLLGDAAVRPGGNFWRAMPRSCLRLICGQKNGSASAQNCTLPTI